MNVLVDTSVWSHALRKNVRQDDPIIRELFELIHEMRVVIIGPIRQEILSGISDKNKYQMLMDRLRSFEDVPITTEHYELAAQLFNQCRRNGIQGSHIDFLICSVSIKNDFSIFTLDKDFEKFRKNINIKLHSIRDINK
jgi:predicted nucleic acid-binding protein